MNMKKNKEQMTIPMEYYYKGHHNEHIVLCKNSFGNIEIRTSYGEFVGVYSCGNTLCVAMYELINGKYM